MSKENAHRMKRVKSTGLIRVCTILALAVGCSDGKDRDSGDGGSSDDDSGVIDDAGVRTLCPIPENHPTCQVPADCGNDEPSPTNCAFCQDYNRSLCAVGQCMTPEQLGGGDSHSFRFGVGSLEVDLVDGSFAGMVLDKETAGGQLITCEDVYATSFNINDDCYNVLDSRGSPAVAVAADTYQIFFSRFASGRKALFLVYGFSQEKAEGTPIGVSCTEFQVGNPGVGPQTVPGDMMRRIP